MQALPHKSVEMRTHFLLHDLGFFFFSLKALGMTHHDSDLQCHDWGQALSFDFVDHRHVTIGYDSYVAAGSSHRVIKNAGLNLPFITEGSLDPCERAA